MEPAPQTESTNVELAAESTRDSQCSICMHDFNQRVELIECRHAFWYVKPSLHVYMSSKLVLYYAHLAHARLKGAWGEMDLESALTSIHAVFPCSFGCIDKWAREGREAACPLCKVALTDVLTVDGSVLKLHKGKSAHHDEGMSVENIAYV
eukprot:4339105-Pyramimonas_sp.AAC.1